MRRNFCHLWLLLWICIQQSSRPGFSFQQKSAFRSSLLNIPTVNSWSRSLTPHRSRKWYNAHPVSWRLQGMSNVQKIPRSAANLGGEQPPLPPGGCSNDVNLTALLSHWTQQVTARWSVVPTGPDEVTRVCARWHEVLGAEKMAQAVLRHLLRPPESPIGFASWQQKEDFLRTSALAEDIGLTLARACLAQERAAGSAPHEVDSAQERVVFRKGGAMLLQQALSVLQVLPPPLSGYPSASPLASASPAAGATQRAPAFPLSMRGRHQVLQRDLSLLRRMHSYNCSAFPWLQAPFSLPPRRPPPLWTTLYREGFPDTALRRRQGTCVKVSEDSCQLQALRDDERQGRLKGLFAGLNILGSTAWTVNRRVLAVARQLVQHIDVTPTTMSEAFYSPAESHSTSFLAPLPALHPTLSATSFSSQRQYAAYQKTRAVEVAEHDKAAQRLMEARLALQMAEELAASPDEPAFYMPYAADFRGRAYSLVPYLCPTGGSFARSLLQFHRGRALGSDGFFWLKVQLANSYGWGKLSLQDRVQRVDQNMASIRASAADPLGMSRTGCNVTSLWWRTADNPWLCLAACFEVDAALQHAEKENGSGDCESFVSNLPVMLDGSCNGLQHYAALARDPAGSTCIVLLSVSHTAPALTTTCNFQRWSHGEFITLFAADGCLCYGGGKNKCSGVGRLS